jgi:hypothetical protein
MASGEQPPVLVVLDQVRGLLTRRLERCVTTRGQFDLDIAAAFERVLDELGNVELIFDDEHPPAIRTRSGD